MKYYESLFIVHPNHEQDKLTHIVEAAKKEIARLKGHLLSEDNWGKRRLGYPIEKQKYGTYVLLQYESENAGINRELANWMKLTPEILAHIIVSLKRKPETEKAPDEQ